MPPLFAVLSAHRDARGLRAKESHGEVMHTRAREEGELIGMLQAFGLEDEAVQHLSSNPCVIDPLFYSVRHPSHPTLLPLVFCCCCLAYFFWPHRLPIERQGKKDAVLGQGDRKSGGAGWMPEATKCRIAQQAGRCGCAKGCDGSSSRGGHAAENSGCVFSSLSQNCVPMSTATAS